MKGSGVPKPEAFCGRGAIAVLGGTTVVAFSTLNRRMSRDVDQLHDALWDPAWKGDREKLLADLREDARDLDAFLRAGGKLRRNADTLAKGWGGPGAGESLFELLDHAYNFAAATERLRKRDFKGAGRHVAAAVESVTIGVCANAGCFEFVNEWESGKTDFETYMAKLTDFLQSKGIERVGEWKRIVVAARTFGRDFDETASATRQALGARAAILSGLWAAVASIDIRAPLGSPPKFPVKDFAAVAGRVAAKI